MVKFINLVIALISIAVIFGCSKDSESAQTIILDGIAVVGVPATNDGEPWDISIEGVVSGPDVYWTITGPQEYSSSTWFKDVIIDEVIFTGSDFPIELPNDGETYTLSFYNKNNLDDTDSGQDDELIASKSFESITEPDCPEGTMAVWYLYYDYWKWECIVVD